MSDVTVTSWVRVDTGCPIRAEVIGSAETEFTCGRRPGEFEFIMEADALREFLKVGTTALEEMDALFAQEEAQRQPQC
jgi:hypothetical protein